MPEIQNQSRYSFGGKVLIFTGPTPLPRVAENEYKTFTVGATHLVSPSSLFWGWLNAGICSLRTVRIASGESQD
jgi:hypothetical protein